MKKLALGYALLLLSGCAPQQPLKPQVVEVLPLDFPLARFDSAVERQQIPAPEVNNAAVENYAAPAASHFLVTLEKLDYLNYAVCGLMYMERPYPTAPVMNLVAVTEKWVPINGATTAVLHFKLNTPPLNDELVPPPIP